MAIERTRQDGRMTLEEFLELEKSDPGHRYEFIDGHPYIKKQPNHPIS